MRLSRRAAGAAILSFVAARGAGAQAYPSKPIRLVVPFAPGGNADLTGRLFGEALVKRLGQQIVIENRGGAGGAIGGEVVSKAAPDGYTLVLGSTNTFTVAPRMTGGTPPYTLASFAPVALLSTSSMVIVVNATSALRGWPDMLSYLKASPGKLSIGHSGNGSTNHLAVLRLQQAAAVRFNIIPYKSMGPALNDLLAGQIDAGIDQIPSSIGHIRAGRLRAIAVTSLGRAIELPDTPSLHESGVKDFDAVTPLLLMAPPGTPSGIVTALNIAVSDALGDPAVASRLAELGATTKAVTPDALAKFLAEEDRAIEDLAKSGLLKTE